MNLHCLLVNSLLAALSWNSGQQPGSSETCPEYDRVGYSAPRRDWPGSIQVESIPVESGVVRKAAGKKMHRFPQGTASYLMREPGTTKLGLWTTVVDVFGNHAHAVHLRIRL